MVFSRDLHKFTEANYGLHCTQGPAHLHKTCLIDGLLFSSYPGSEDDTIAALLASEDQPTTEADYVV